MDEELIWFYQPNHVNLLRGYLLIVLYNDNQEDTYNPPHSQYILIHRIRIDESMIGNQ